MLHESFHKLMAAGLATGIAAALFALPVKSQQGVHGEGHAQLHHWYTSLHDKAGRSCCNMQDCRPTEARVRNGAVEMLVDGEWTVVPPEKILNKASPDLGSHVCSPAPTGLYPKGHVFCAVIGSGV
jgi:hypothetical protein